MGWIGSQFVKAINPGRIEPNITTWQEMGPISGQMKAEFLDPVQFGSAENISPFEHQRVVRVWP